MPSARRFLPLACIASLLSACAGDAKTDFDSLQSTGRIKAAVQAAELNDRSAVPELVVMLNSDDPAERLVAISALHKITGQSLGYDESAPETDRDAAIARWQAFVEDANASPHASPTAPPADTPPR